MVALQGDVLLVVKSVRVRTIIGWAIAVIAVLFCLLGLLGNKPPFTVAGVLGGFALLVAAILLAARLARPLVRGMAAPLRSRPIVRLAADNALRNPRRTAATVSALLVGVALATGIAVLGDSAASVGRTAATQAIRAPFVAANIGDAQIADNTIQRIRAVPGVTAAAAIRRVTAVIDEETISLAAIDPAALGTLLDIDLRSGSPADLRRGAFAHEALITEYGWSTGQTIHVFFGGARVPLTITGAHADTPLVGDGLLVPDALPSGTSGQAAATPSSSPPDPMPGTS